MITSQNKNLDVLLSKVLLLSICLFIISMNKGREMTIITITPKQRIVPIIIPEDTLQKLNKFLGNMSDMFKRDMMHKISGECMICHSIPDYMVIYDLDGASKVERYCDSCIKKVELQYSQRN